MKEELKAQIKELTDKMTRQQEKIKYVSCQSSRKAVAEKIKSSNF